MTGRKADLGNVHIISNNFWGEGGQRFVTKPCRKVGICTVFVTKRERGSEKSKNRVTYYVDVPLIRSDIVLQIAIQT